MFFETESVAMPGDVTVQKAMIIRNSLAIAIDAFAGRQSLPFYDTLPYAEGGQIKNHHQENTDTTLGSLGR